MGTLIDFGGAVEKGEDRWTAAVRELCEETLGQVSCEGSLPLVPAPKADVDALLDERELQASPQVLQAIRSFEGVQPGPLVYNPLIMYGCYLQVLSFLF